MLLRLEYDRRKVATRSLATVFLLCIAVVVLQYSLLGEKPKVVVAFGSFVYLCFVLYLLAWSVRALMGFPYLTVDDDGTTYILTLFTRKHLRAQPSSRLEVTRRRVVFSSLSSVDRAGSISPLTLPLPGSLKPFDTKVFLISGESASTNT